jgi:hypothetical protein
MVRNVNKASNSRLRSNRMTPNIMKIMVSDRVLEKNVQGVKVKD